MDALLSQSPWQLAVSALSGLGVACWLSYGTPAVSLTKSSAEPPAVAMTPDMMKGYGLVRSVKMG